MIRRLRTLIALAVGLAQGCAAVAAEDVVLAIANAGAEPLRCLVIHGHWVTGEVPVIAPGATVELAILRDPAERSLFTLRADGRRLMIEQIACGLDDDWSATLVHVGVDLARTSAATRFTLACDAGRAGGCTSWTAGP